jgi:hypothetical protein
MLKTIAAALSLAVLGIAALLFWPADHATDPAARAAYMAKPHMQLASYKFDRDSSLLSRVKAPPDFILAFLREYDSAPEYAAAEPTAGQKELIGSLLSALPETVTALLEERLLGVYLVKNFKGNGFTTPLLAPEDEEGAYVWLVINPASFSSTLSQTLSGREQSAFTAGAGAVAAVCPGKDGKELPGAAYALSHEIGHAVDYIKTVSPFVTEDFYKLKYVMPPEIKSWGGWLNYSTPRPEFDHKLRGKARFYGMGGGPLLETSDAEPLYSWLAGSPYTSLYGSQNWAEDFAEKFSFAYLSALQDGRPCAIVYPGGKFAPGPLAATRAEHSFSRFE